MCGRATLIDNDILEDLCCESNCEDLTNEFQSLHISVNETAIAFIQNHYNDWFSNQVTIQIKRGADPADVKISSKLYDLKLMHTPWIVDLYDYMFKRPQIIMVLMVRESQRL